VRSSHAYGVKVSGLRWLGCILLTPIVCLGLALYDRAVPLRALL
jgi:hypothetical protein